MGAENNNLAPQDVAELATWVSDQIDPTLVKRWREETVPALFAESANDLGVMLGPIRFFELKPGEDRAGQPPPHIRGDNVRLLVAECRVLGFAPERRDDSFLADLDFKDLQRLRRITKRAALPHVLSDADADQIIERYGPVTAQSVLKASIDERTIH